VRVGLNGTGNLTASLDGSPLSFSWLDKRTIRRGSEVLSDPTLTGPPTHMFAGVSFALASPGELNFTGPGSNSTDVASRVIIVPSVQMLTNGTNSSAGNSTNGTTTITETVTATGISFQANLFAEVRIGLQGYNRQVAATANLSLWRYSGETGSWRGVECHSAEDSSTGSPLTINETKWTYAGRLCGKGQYAVFVQMNEGGVGINSVEENIVTSLGQVLVRTAPVTASVNGTSGTGEVANGTTIARNGTAAADDNATDFQAAAFAQQNNNRVLGVLDTVASVISGELSTDDPEAIVETPTVSLAAGKKTKDGLSNARTVLPGANAAAVTLPEGFGNALAAGEDTVTISLTAMRNNPYAWSQTANIHSDVVSLGFKGSDAMPIAIDGLSDEASIEVIIPVSPLRGVLNYPVFFDTTKYLTGCEPANASYCFGSWSNLGLEQAAEVRPVSCFIANGWL